MMRQILKDIQTGYIIQVIGQNKLNPTEGYKNADSIAIALIHSPDNDPEEVQDALVLIKPWSKFLERCDYTEGCCTIDVPSENRDVFPESVKAPMSESDMQELRDIREEPELIPVYMVVVTNNDIHTIATGAPKHAS
jgi:hypothetical protein